MLIRIYRQLRVALSRGIVRLGSLSSSGQSGPRPSPGQLQQQAAPGVYALLVDIEPR